MKIVRKDKEKLVHFGDLNDGDVFIEDVEGDEFLQMKMTPVEEEGTVYNAVSLTTGEAYDMSDATLVRLVEAELIIT